MSLPKTTAAGANIDAAVATTPAAITVNLADAQMQSRLLRLPPELRNTIYSYALSEDMDPCVHDLLHSCPKTGRPLTMPPLLSTCRKTRDEAGSIWYSAATFRFHNVVTLQKWLKRLDIQDQARIRIVKQWDMVKDREAAIDLLLRYEGVLRHSTKLAKGVLMVGYCDDGIVGNDGEVPCTWVS